MNYQQFVHTIEAKIKEQLNEGESVRVNSVLKNNGMNRVGITVVKRGVNISPTIYLEEYFEQFQRHKSLERTVRNILKLYEEIRFDSFFETTMLQNYEKVKGRIVYKLIHAEENEELLEEVPYVLYLDLAIVFYILLEITPMGTATILINEDLLKLWGVDKETLYEAAKKNTKRLLPPEFKTMRSVVQEILGNQENKDGEDIMYVLTNHIRSFGAACILYERVLEDIGNQLGENYYVLPSSVHEVIIIPESKSPNRIDLDEMIEEINDTQVEEEEILSYRAYYYSRKENRLIL